MNEKLMKSFRSYFSVLVFKNFYNKSLEIRRLKTQFSPMVLEVAFCLLSGGEAGSQQTSMELFQSFREKTVRPWNFRV